MPDILQTSDHYKHSRKWTLTGRWGEECIACLVFLLDAQHTPVTKKKSLLGEINHLLRSSDELTRMLSDCELSKNLSKILLSTLVHTQDEIGVECVLLLEKRITCTVHSHSKRILEDVSRKFYEHSNNPRVASYLTKILSTLISENLELRNEVISNKLVDNMCDTLRPSNEQLQNVILTFLLHLHSYTPLYQILSELRLLKLLHNSVTLLSATATVSKAVYLIHALLSNEHIANKHKKNLVNQGKLMQGIKHALAYTKSSDVIATALSLLNILGAPQLIAQYNLLDYILECLSSEDESVCMSALDLCISSQHSNKSSVMYISDSLIALIDREKKRMRGDIIERCLIFLLKLPEIRVPEHFHSIVVALVGWGNETLVSLVCLLLDKFKISCTPIQAMKLLVELIEWLNNNLSQRVRRLPTHAWLQGGSMPMCREGEQVIGMLLGGVAYLVGIILDNLDKLDNSVLKDVIIICDEHCIPPVFILDTSELCPHVYKHLFSVITRVVRTCWQVYGEELLLGDNFASKFVSKVFGLARGFFILRSSLCSAYKHPDVLTALHSFMATTLTVHTSSILPRSSRPLYDMITSGLDVLPYCDLNEALADSLRSAERPSYHTDLLSQSSFCANFTCLLLVLVRVCGDERSGVKKMCGDERSSAKQLCGDERSSAMEMCSDERSSEVPLGCLVQVVNLYGTHRLLPPSFLPPVVKLFSRFNCQQLQGLKLALDTQEQKGNVMYEGFDEEMLLFTLNIENINSATLLKCSNLLLHKFGKEGEKVDIDPKISVKLLRIMIDNGQIKDNLPVLQGLIAKCTDKSIFDSIVTELNSSVMLDAARYDATLTVLISIATCHSFPVNTRSLMVVVQCVLCNSSNIGTSLQYLYINYIVNPTYMSELLANRVDVVACLCSHLKYASPHLNVSLLLLLEHLKHHATCEGVVVEVDEVVEILDRATSTLTLALLWRLLCVVLPAYKEGLGLLALRSLVEPEHESSLSAAVYIRTCDMSASAPWFNTALETSLLLDDMPSGVLWLLAHLTRDHLQRIVAHRLQHLLTCLVRQFRSAHQTVVMNLLLRLYEGFPGAVTKAIAQCARPEEVDERKWFTQPVTFHASSVAVLGATQQRQIRKAYEKLLDYVESV